MDRDRLLEMAVELAKAHLATSQVNTHELAGLVRDIHNTLSELDSHGEPKSSFQNGAEVGEVLPPDDRSGEPRIINKDISAAEFEGLDPWLASRLPRRIAAKLNREPSVHPSVFEDHIVCLEDGEQVKLLRSYLRKRFGMDFLDYVNRWNLPDAFPTAPQTYLDVKRAHARATGLGSTLRAPKGTPRRRRVNQSEGV